MYKILNSLAPHNLNNFTYISDVHSRTTRASSQKVFYLPHHKTNMFRKSFNYQGPKVWNDLPEYIRSSPSVSTFKQSAKKFYM